VLTKRDRIGVQTAALLTSLIGVVNLLSAITPSSRWRTEILEQFVPFEIRAGGHFFAAIAGFILLTLAANLLRRKRVAWWLTVSWLVISIVSHLIKGLDYEESLLAFVLLVQLLWIRPLFTAQSDHPSIAQGVRALVGALLFTLAYGTAGFYLLDREYAQIFDLPEAMLQTLAMFFTADNAGLEPTTRFGQFFADSIDFVGATTIFYALVMLLRPVLLRGAPASEIERQKARTIIEQYGCSSLARFALLDDKTYYFSPSGRSVIAYVPKGRSAIALGDPIGSPEDRREAIVSFQQFCQQNDWYSAFYQTTPDDVELYQSLGFKVLNIGQEAVVNLKEFTLQGKTSQNLRTVVNRFTKLGQEVKFYEPPISDRLLQQLRIVSDEWLHMMHGSEKRFSLGWFDENYLRECEIAVVQTGSGEIMAFANLVSGYKLNEITIDLMRKRTEAEKGTIDFLSVSLFQHFQERGYDGFNLGLSALSGVGETSASPRLEKTLYYLYEHLNQFYNFKGLHEFKEKFHPRWEPRHFVYSGLAALPDVVVGLIRADSGDRLVDYFKPGS
jgi:phosphatidylglycerol lysyltransferase